MVGVVMGHGSHDGTDMITVPRDLPLEFFTEEGAPLAIVNLLELLKPTHHRVPMQTLRPGDPVPNYQYEPFQPHEVSAIDFFNGLTVPNFVVGSPAQLTTIRLCEGDGTCPKDGPHTCDGVLGRAAKGNWTKVLVLSCRVDTRKPVTPSNALMTAANKPDTSVFDTLLNWVKAFVAMAPAVQDATWAALNDVERARFYVSELELKERADCLDVRTKLAAAGRPKAAALIAATPPEIKVRLLRDYPQYRDLVTMGVTLDAIERKGVTAFEFRPIADRTTSWRAMAPAAQLRWMADPAITAWAAARNVLDLFDFGLSGAQLVAVFRKLDPAAQKIALGEQALRDNLVAHGLRI